MTAQEIITEVRGIIQETDPNNSHVSDSELLGLINACTLQLVSRMNTFPKASIPDITTQATITLPEELLRLDYASYTKADGRKVKLGTIDFNNFVRLYPDWENTPAGRPEFLVRMTDADWMLHPSPDAAHTGLAMSLFGSVNPDPLTSSSEEPPVGIVLHCVYPHFVAWKCFLKINMPERATAEYATFSALRKIHIGTATSTQGSMKSFKWGV